MAELTDFEPVKIACSPDPESGNGSYSYTWLYMSQRPSGLQGLFAIKIYAATVHTVDSHTTLHVQQSSVQAVQCTGVPYIKW